MVIRLSTKQDIGGYKDKYKYKSKDKIKGLKAFIELKDKSKRLKTNTKDKGLKTI